MHIASEKQRTRRQFLATSVALTAASAARAANWNQWRGPTRDGRVAEAADWPDALSEDHLKEVWRTELGPSYSGPIVADNRVFVTETVDEAKETVQALSLTEGNRLWTAEWSGAMSVPFFARSNGSWIRSTPAAAENKLLVGGMRDVLVCLDVETGAEIWRNDFVATQGTPLPSFGFVCSPLVVGPHVYVQAAAGFLKLELATGNVIWKALDDGGGMLGSAFSSPILTMLAGQEQLVVQTRTKLAGVDSKDGSVLWSIDVPAFRGMNILTPTIVGDSVFTSSYGGGSFCFDVRRSDAGFDVTEKWSNRVQGYMSSPLVFDDHVYLHLRNQRFTCIELSTGKQRWSTRPFGKYWSMVAKQDKILALDERGDLLLIRPRPEEFELLDRRRLADNAWAHLAVVDDLVLIRELNALAVYRWS